MSRPPICATVCLVQTSVQTTRVAAMVQYIPPHFYPSFDPNYCRGCGTELYISKSNEMKMPAALAGQDNSIDDGKLPDRPRPINRTIICTIEPNTPLAMMSLQQFRKK